jgi:ribosomal protein L33
MEWLLVEQHSDGTSPSGIAQTWGSGSEMRCMSCNFEGIGSQFGFTGEDVYLNHGPETMGLMPTQQVPPTEYIRYKCKTCGSISYTAAANASTKEEKLLLRCENAHQHTYDENEIERVQLQSSPEFRAAMGLD